MKKFILWLINKLSLRCPDCGGIIKSDFLDMEIDHMVYKCEQCGKQWL